MKAYLVKCLSCEYIGMSIDTMIVGDNMYCPLCGSEVEETEEEKTK